MILGPHCLINALESAFAASTPLQMYNPVMASNCMSQNCFAKSSESRPCSRRRLKRIDATSLKGLGRDLSHCVRMSNARGPA